MTNKNFIYSILLFCLIFIHQAAAQQTGKWGDQGNGTYRNPILPSDYSDPDVIRVGNDYYLISSTFQLSPGMVILHSRDLVNWETLSYAVDDVTKLGGNFNWDKMDRYNRGIYAGSIRYHNGIFYIHFTTLNEGIFVAKSEKITGTWEVQLMKDKNGKPINSEWWDDTCSFWDDDGKAYLITSKLKEGWYPHIFRMSEDGTQLLDSEVEQMDKPGPQKTGDGVYPYTKRTAEGNKIYKINGYYYLFHNEVTEPEKYRIGMMKRAKSIYGDHPDGTPGTAENPGVYEVRKFLRGTSPADLEPNQGGLVDTPDGKWFFITHQGKGSPQGRALSLLPVKWVDNFPIPGMPDSENIGTIVWEFPKPINGFPVKFPQGSDEFNNKTINPDWQWNYQSKAGTWSLTERKGFLRLYAYKPIKPNEIFTAGNTLAQRYFKSDAVEAVIKMDISRMADGQESGFIHFNGGVNYSTIGVSQKNGVKHLKFDIDKAVVEGVEIPAKVKDIWFRSAVDDKYQNRFAYSFDGKTYTDFGSVYVLKWGKYRGDYLGIYNYNNEADKGCIDVDGFHYKFSH